MYKISKHGFIFFVILALVVSISTVSDVGYAQDFSMGNSYHSSERSGAKMAADIVFLRPVGIVATALGTALFIVSSPFSVLGNNSEEAEENLIKKPGRFTFKRPLGDF